MVHPSLDKIDAIYRTLREEIAELTERHISAKSEVRALRIPPPNAACAWPRTAGTRGALRRLMLRLTRGC